nr:ER membrane protein complex subunit 6 [Ipomoea batatas]
MAGRDDSNGGKEKSGNGIDELPTFSAENMQNNMKVIYYSRTFMSIIGGVIAGILGLTGLMGFIFYFLIMGITSAGLIAKAKFSVFSYFDNWNRIILDGFLGGLLAIKASDLLDCSIKKPSNLTTKLSSVMESKPQGRLQRCHSTGDRKKNELEASLPSFYGRDYRRNPLNAVGSFVHAPLLDHPSYGMVWYEIIVRQLLIGHHACPVPFFNSPAPSRCSLARTGFRWTMWPDLSSSPGKSGTENEWLGVIIKS